VVEVMKASFDSFSAGIRLTAYLGKLQREELTREHGGGFFYLPVSLLYSVIFRFFINSIVDQNIFASRNSVNSYIKDSNLNLFSDQCF
jgi:hypothetical protein